MEPSSRIAHECVSPVEIATAVLPVPKLSVWVGEFRRVVVPSPIWPHPFSPQQATEPSSSIAHVCVWPDVIDTAVLPAPRLAVWVGACRSVVVPSPTRPNTLCPQQATEPSSSIAHVCWKPAEIATAVLPAPRLAVWVGTCRSVVVPSPSLPNEFFPPTDDRAVVKQCARVRIA